jgi:hypothetical protein
MSEFKIEIEEIPNPFVQSFTLFAGTPAKFISEIAEKKELFVEIHDRTKTRFSIDMQVGEIRYSVNTYPEEQTAETYPFKLHSEKSFNYVQGQTQEHSFFVKSKKQGWPQMLQHIENLVNSYVVKNVKKLYPEVNNLTVKIYQNKAVQMLKA